MTNWTDIEQEANKVLRDNRITEPLVDVLSIAESANIDIIPIIPDHDQRPYSGFLDTNGDAPVMYINADESPARVNWTIAHELGHHFLRHKPDAWGIAWREPTEKEKTPEEKEADYFAACLLTPQHMIQRRMRQYKLRPDDAVLLAKMFGISPTAMKHRLNFLRMK